MADLTPAQRDAIERAKTSPYHWVHALPATIRALDRLGYVRVGYITEGMDGPIYGWVLTEKANP